jgi:hypothetical protein
LSIAGNVFWTIFWRSIVIALLVAALLEAIPFWLLSTGRMDETTHFALHWVLQFLAYACGGLTAVRMALRKQYRGFRFQLVLDAGNQQPS